MVKYLLTKKAVDDLSGIWEYTFEVWSEQQADSYYKLLISSFQEICSNPELGKKYDEIDSAVLGLRAGRHIVFYRLTQKRDIEVIRILHQSMDLKSRMKE